MKRTLTVFSLAFMVPLAMIAQKDINKSFTGVKTIRMTTASGSCKFVKSNDGKVSVNLRHTYDDKEFEPVIELDGDRLEIRERYNGNNINGSADWTLAVPDGLDIRFITGSGTIEASDMKLNMKANTGSGDLIFRKINGELSANAGSGELELDDFNGELDVNIGSGNATIINAKGNIGLNCGSGTIRISDSNAEFLANTGSGHVRGRNLTLAGSSRFNSGSGNTEVVLGASPKFDIAVNSGSGNAELNFNGNEIAGEITMQASRRNGRITAPFEFDHTEEISRGDDQIVIKKTVVKKVVTPHISVGTGSGEASIKQ